MRTSSEMVSEGPSAFPFSPEESSADYWIMFVLLLPSCRYGHFSGINRKVQLTYLPHGQPKTSSEEEGAEMSAEYFYVGGEFLCLPSWCILSHLQTLERKVHLCCWC